MLQAIVRFPGLQAFQAPVYPDERGTLIQSFVRSGLEARGIPGDFKQAIQNRSHLGVVRGLHFQWQPPQGKLIRCVSGRVHDVVVDLRPESPTCGDHAAVELSERNNLVLWVPPGFAHGFLVLEEDSVVLYFCTEEWNPAGEGGLRYDDPALGIAWPRAAVLISSKDKANLTLQAWLSDPRSAAFQFRP
jgi:dTDP-4-dehydrorhamnose 3,5-epimerase